MDQLPTAIKVTPSRIPARQIDLRRMFFSLNKKAANVNDTKTLLRLIGDINDIKLSEH